MIQLHWVIAWQIFTKPNIFLPYDPAVVLLGIYAKELKIKCPYKNLHKSLYCSFIQDCQDVDATKMSISM